MLVFLRQIHPAKPLLLVGMVVLLLALLAAFYPGVSLLWLVALSVIGLLALSDAFLLLAQPAPLLSRHVAPNLALGAASAVQLKVISQSRQHLDLEIHDQPAETFEHLGLPQSLRLHSEQAHSIRYQVIPQQRGNHTFGQVRCSSRSPLGLWRRLQLLGSAESVRVFPNFAEVQHYALLARRNRLSSAGIRRRQRRGGGSDFHQLRDYQQGDTLRQVDWKATARYRRLISREYQDEQNQHLFFLLDCGQHMLHRDQGIQHLDNALNAMLLASHVANAQGDTVGYMTFAGDNRYQAPSRGSGSVPALLRSVYDVEARPVAADYLRLADEFLSKKLPRALVVLLTNTRDSDYEDLLLAVKILQSKHLVIVADLRESALEDGLRQTVSSTESALRFHTTQALRESRLAMHNQMKHHGALVLDITPQQLPLALVNEYFDIKRGGRL